MNLKFTNLFTFLSIIIILNLVFFQSSICLNDDLLYEKKIMKEPDSILKKLVNVSDLKEMKSIEYDNNKIGEKQRITNDIINNFLNNCNCNNKNISEKSTINSSFICSILYPIYILLVIISKIISPFFNPPLLFFVVINLGIRYNCWWVPY
jgi:hypothetical protein